MLPYLFLIFCVFACISAQGVQETAITIQINLNKTLGDRDRELHSSIIHLPAISKTNFIFSNVNENVTFIIFQAHSHFYDISMCNGTCTNHSMKNGTNIGLFSHVNPMSDFNIYNHNKNDIKVLIAVHGYFVDDVIPGGCNMDDPIEIPPYITTKLSSKRDYIDIATAAPAPNSTMSAGNCQDANVYVLNFYMMYLPERDFSIETYFGGIRAMMNVDSILENGEKKYHHTYITTKLSPKRDYIDIATAAPAPNSTMSAGNCQDANVYVLNFYMMYLPERDFSIETYFGGIRAMMNVDSILENGEKIPQTHISRLRRTISAYPGTGAVFVALVDISAMREDNTTFDIISIYVPTVTYVCSPLVEEDCILLGDLLSQVLCASLLFVGLFICYFGHKFFKTEMFIFGMMSGVIVSYIFISLIAEMEQAPLIGASFLSGILFGFIWLTFWWFYGIPVFSVLLATLAFGFFASCVLYNRMPGAIEVMMQDGNFWTLFILVMFLTAVILTPATYPANILCCSILGAYAAIYPIDYCIGSNLKYLIINTVRRATVENFYYAVLAPPFEKYDALLVLLWVTLATTGFLYQHYHNRGKPPFPPPPRNIRERPEGFSYGTGTTSTRVSTDPPIRSTANLAQTERTPLLA